MNRPFTRWAAIAALLLLAVAFIMGYGSLVESKTHTDYQLLSAVGYALLAALYVTGALRFFGKRKRALIGDSRLIRSLSNVYGRA